MDDKTKALLDALERADECRRDDPMLRVCHTCWDELIQSAEALAEALEPGERPPYTMG